MTSELSALGALAMNWLDTTHGNELGHDHHCPLYRDTLAEYQHLGPITAGDPDVCTCGWASFYTKYLALAGGSDG